jgi:pimeloyl-ACP methyl ester carboxylesterase
METVANPVRATFDAPLRFGHRIGGLAYHIFNHDGTETIVLLHCAGTGAPEWDTVIPHFSKHYQLLVPDLPLHNQSTDVKLEHPAADTADVLGDLVSSQAKQGKAHVVGMSLGSHIGRRLAIQRPEVVNTCFLCGYNRVDNLAWAPLKPYLPHMIYAAEMLVSTVPKAWIDGIDHTADTTTPLTFEHFKKVWALVTDDNMRDTPWKARTLMVAATKGGLLATSDSVKDAKDAALLGQKKTPETKAVQNRGMRHAWSRQDPKLFAETALCWIEERPLPDGFEML